MSCKYCEFKPSYEGKNMIDSDVFHKGEIALTQIDSGNYTLDVYVHTHDVANDYEQAFTEKVNYCPMCGRKLVSHA